MWGACAVVEPGWKGPSPRMRSCWLTSCSQAKRREELCSPRSFRGGEEAWKACSSVPHGGEELS